MLLPKVSKLLQTQTPYTTHICWCIYKDGTEQGTMVAQKCLNSCRLKPHILHTFFDAFTKMALNRELWWPRRAISITDFNTSNNQFWIFSLLTSVWIFLTTSLEFSHFRLPICIFLFTKFTFSVGHFLLPILTFLISNFDISHDGHYYFWYLHVYKRVIASYRDQRELLQPHFPPPSLH